METIESEDYGVHKISNTILDSNCVFSRNTRSNIMENEIDRKETNEEEEQDKDETNQSSHFVSSLSGEEKSKSKIHEKDFNVMKLPSSRDSSSLPLLSIPTTMYSRSSGKSYSTTKTKSKTFSKVKSKNSFRMRRIDLLLAIMSTFYTVVRCWTSPFHSASVRSTPSTTST